jgi:mannose-6-phosphate isomerase-like protein (cupin superfamily)
MQTMRAEDAAPHRFSDHRGDGIQFQRLLQGNPDSSDNYEWSIVHFGEEYTTPRHHHNFSQIHLVLEGLHEWSPTVDMPEGSVTYSPEGTFYGPQQGHGARVLTLQYGEASLSGFMSYERLAEGSKRLAESPNGRFEDGIWRYVDDEGKQRNKDGYEAIWEEIHGRAVEYPSPRYQTPITMHPEAFSWVPSRDEPGIDHKHLATVSERQTRIGFTRYDGGAVHRVVDLPTPELHFVVSGALEVSSGVYPACSAFRFDPGDDATLTALDPTTTFVIGLPQVDDVS